MKQLFVNSILAAGMTLLSAASYAQIPISSVPFTISTPGDYIFANDLIYPGASGNAITVNAHHVTIDLDGHYLWCSAAGNTASGIYADNKANVTVKNGEIIGFYHGVGFDYSGVGTNINSGHLVDGLRLTSDQFAAWLHVSTSCVVRNCQIFKGFVGVDFFNGTGNRAVNNVASGVTFGFFSDGTDYFDSNYADHCTNGIDATSATTKFRFNTTTNCTTPVSGGTSEFSSDL